MKMLSCLQRPKYHFSPQSSHFLGKQRLFSNIAFICYGIQLSYRLYLMLSFISRGVKACRIWFEGSILAGTPSTNTISQVKID